MYTLYVHMYAIYTDYVQFPEEEYRDSIEDRDRYIEHRCVYCCTERQLERSIDVSIEIERQIDRDGKQKGKDRTAGCGDGGLKVLK